MDMTNTTTTTTPRVVVVVELMLVVTDAVNVNCYGWIIRMLIIIEGGASAPDDLMGA